MNYFKNCQKASTVLILGVLFFVNSGFAANKQNAHKRHHKADSTAAVSINQGTEKQLIELKGLGASKAEAIIAYRKTHGSFKSIAQLSQVKGISDKTVAKLKEKNPGRLLLKNKP